MSKSITANELKRAFESAYANLENHKQSVNDLNVFPVPDGDTGTNMALTMQFAVKELEKADCDTCDGVATAAANGALMGARGNSGVILSQLIRGFSKALSGKEELSLDDIILAMRQAKEMAYKAVMKPTEGTILTVAREMSEFADLQGRSYPSFTAFVEAVIERGQVSLENTPNLLAVLKEAGVVDSGGKGLLFLLQGALASLRGEDVVLRREEQQPHAQDKKSVNEEFSAEITFQYCTEFLIGARDTKKDYQAFLIEKLVKLGDSLLVVGDERIIKVHVHTNEPWTAMKYAASCGDLLKIKIENMKEQAQDAFGILTDEDVQMARQNAPAKDDVSKAPQYDSSQMEYCVISVCAGDGFAAILRDLGVAYLIEGGQTMNPSTQDFLDIITHTNAKHYILMPNNKNIIMAAQQACEMSEDKDVHVLATKTIPQAITAMLFYDPESGVDEMMQAMQDAISNVATGQLTFAVRDTSVGSLSIKKGDVIGIVDGEIKVCCKTVDEALTALVTTMTSTGGEVLTLYYGEDIAEEDAQLVFASIEKEYPDWETILQKGGQPLYYYIVSVE